MNYQAPITINSNPNPDLRAEEPKGFWFTVFFVYIPTIIVVLLIRCVMLRHHVEIIDLRMVDAFLLDFMDYARTAYLNGTL